MPTLLLVDVSRDCLSAIRRLLLNKIASAVPRNGDTEDVRLVVQIQMVGDRLRSQSCPDGRHAVALLGRTVSCTVESFTIRSLLTGGHAGSLQPRQWGGDESFLEILNHR